MTAPLAGARVLVMGIGRRAGGVGVIRYALGSGADVRVTDRADPAVFAAVVEEFRGEPVTFVLGRHDDADFEWADVVVRNPDVRRDSPYLAVAEAHGARVEMEMTLFLAASPAPTIGVTGTKGKTTTTLLLHSMLREHWPTSVVAGNMGRSALARLGDVEPGVPVALELSSFQLEGLGEHARSPHVAVVTNLRPDHLDRYASLGEYAAARASRRLCAPGTASASTGPRSRRLPSQSATKRPSATNSVRSPSWRPSAKVTRRPRVPATSGRTASSSAG